jgi:hypothetical protein
MIWLLAIIYFISGVPGAYVLWYRPLYNAMRLFIWIHLLIYYFFNVSMFLVIIYLVLFECLL